MAEELLFTVDGPNAVPARRITLAEAGLLERRHLQQWVIDHPELIGAGVKVVTFEFGKWISAGGTTAADRLDVLGLDRTGRLVVAEFKRDRAPDTVTMQAINYAAMVSRFSLSVMADVAGDGPGDDRLRRATRPPRAGKPRLDSRAARIAVCPDVRTPVRQTGVRSPGGLIVDSA